MGERRRGRRIGDLIRDQCRRQVPDLQEYSRGEQNRGGTKDHYFGLMVSRHFHGCVLQSEANIAPFGLWKNFAHTE